MKREAFMRRALALARKAASLGEVPVGAVVVRNGEIVATGYNKRETGKDALAHAEMIAIHRACKRLGTWRLSDCDLYVTLEPCPMCTGALINARMRTVYIACPDPKGGCMGSVCDLTALGFNHKPAVEWGLLEEECSALLTDFFRTLRVKPEPKLVSLGVFEQTHAPLLKQHVFANLSLKAVGQTIEEWKTHLHDGVYCDFFALLVDGDPVGYVSLMQKAPDTVSVGAHVFSCSRGKTYGTQGVRLALAHAKSLGYVQATARVRKSNVPSNRLCDRIGFEKTGEDVTDRGDGVFCYSLRLE